MKKSNIEQQLQSHKWLNQLIENQINEIKQLIKILAMNIKAIN